MKRWPIIRHIRWYLLAREVDRHYALWRKLGYLPFHRGHDEEILDKVWRGEI